MKQHETFIFKNHLVEVMSVWKKLFKKREKPKPIDAHKDMEAVSDFLENCEGQIKSLLNDLNKLEELEKEYHVASEGIIQINLETQAKILDKLIQKYEFFQSDADINGLRVKMIVKEFLRRAEHHGLKDLVKEKKKDANWLMRW